LEVVNRFLALELVPELGVKLAPSDLDRLFQRVQAAREEAVSVQRHRRMGQGADGAGIERHGVFEQASQIFPRKLKTSRPQGEPVLLRCHPCPEFFDGLRVERDGFVADGEAQRHPARGQGFHLPLEQRVGVAALVV